MRLLNTETGEFQSVDDPRRVRYAILSHVWAKPGDHDYIPEQTYHDLLRLQDEARADGTLSISKFSAKLRRFCETASRAGFKLCWVDTCCIDKASSSELSEAINSMYRWYANAGACYAFLHDVKPRSVGSDQSRWRSNFVKSKWFTRGWTLQELIASRVVIFVCHESGPDGGWQVMGSKHNLAAAISSVTNVDTTVLTFEKSLQEISIARRMAWAHNRETSRLEDEAYCLMGIFGVNMQTNYGEGRHAFIRLQEAILSQSPDQTIFAWGGFLDAPLLTLLPSNSGPSAILEEAAGPPNLSHNAVAPASFGSKQYLLASSPKDFNPGHSAKIVPLSRETFQQRLGVHVLEDLYQVFETTPYGHRAHFPLLDVQAPNPGLAGAPTHCAILACEDPDKGLLSLLLRRRNHLQVTGNEFFAGAVVGPKLPRRLAQDDAAVWADYYRLTYITPHQLSSLRKSAAVASSPRRPPTLPRVSVVYISRCPSWSSSDLDPPSVPPGLYGTLEDFDVEFSAWSRMVLEGDGYRVFGDPSLAPDEPKFADSQSILGRTPPSSRRANHVTISNNSGVYLSVQVGRCSCDLGRREGILGVLVSSRDPDALDGRFSSDRDDDHLIDHPLHVHSWSLDHGSLSRQIEFDAPNDSGVGQGRFSLRLTLTTAPAFEPLSARIPGTSTSSTSVLRVYRLSAELRERDRCEYGEMPRPPPDRDTVGPSRVTRRRSNSAPSLHIVHWLPRREPPPVSFEI